MSACMVGWAHTPFGRLDQHDIESLIQKVTTEAIADAGLQPSDIDEIFGGDDVSAAGLRAIMRGSSSSAVYI